MTAGCEAQTERLRFAAADSVSALALTAAGQQGHASESGEHHADSAGLGHRGDVSAGRAVISIGREIVGTRQATCEIDRQLLVQIAERCLSGERDHVRIGRRDHPRKTAARSRDKAHSIVRPGSHFNITNYVKNGAPRCARKFD